MYEKLLKKYMEEVRPRYTCEWGSGKSTDIILSYDCVKAHVAIEHNELKYKDISTKSYEGRLFSYLVPDLDLYPTYPVTIANDMGMEFKLVLINGVEKIKCLEQAKGFLHFFGVAIMTDAQKLKYMKPMNEYFPKQDWDMPQNESYTVALKTFKYGNTKDK